MRPSFDAAMDGLEDARNERDQALAALRELYEAQLAVDEGVASFDLHASAIERLVSAREEAHDLLEELS